MRTNERRCGAAGTAFTEALSIDKIKGGSRQTPDASRTAYR